MAELAFGRSDIDAMLTDYPKRPPTDADANTPAYRTLVAAFRFGRILPPDRDHAALHVWIG
jgi:hypothetical protein